MPKDINEDPYDEATLIKLDIFEQYLTAWLPVFIKTPFIHNVMICDFFAGSGRDSENVPGSPLRILSTIEKYKTEIINENFHISVLLNEGLEDKSNRLQEACSKSFDEELKENVKVIFHNQKFQTLFNQQYERLKQQPNLIFIDQYGVKEVTDEIFQKLIDLQKTDFLFFISSSSLRRFAKTPEFQNYFTDLDPDKITTAKYENIHRIILDYYKSKIPPENKIKLYPFTLKKGSNIYGLVFGSKHPLGVEKFLDSAWNQNAINGQANFDIDDDIKKQHPVLFSEMKLPTKLEVFEAELEDYIKGQGELTNRQVYDFTLDKGHKNSHAHNCIAKLKKEGKIECDLRMGLSYKFCYKEGKVYPIKWVAQK